MIKSEERVANRLKRLNWKIIQPTRINKLAFENPLPDFYIYKNNLKRKIEVKTSSYKDTVINYHTNFHFIIAYVKPRTFYVIPKSKINLKCYYFHLRNYEKYKNRFELLN